MRLMLRFWQVENVCAHPPSKRLMCRAVVTYCAAVGVGRADVTRGVGRDVVAASNSEHRYE